MSVELREGREERYARVPLALPVFCKLFDFNWLHWRGQWHTAFYIKLTQTSRSLFHSALN